MYYTYVCTYITHSTQPVITHNNTLRGSVHKARKVTWMAHVKVQIDAFCDGAASRALIWLGAHGNQSHEHNIGRWSYHGGGEGGYIKATEVRLSAFLNHVLIAKCVA